MPRSSAASIRLRVTRADFGNWSAKESPEGETLIAAFEKIAGPIPDAYAARLRAADLEAYLAAAHDRVGMEDMLEAMAMPCCLYAGGADPPAC